MDNLWRDEDAGESDIGQLVYLSNLIGADSLLVQPGGGNTSLKSKAADLYGDESDVLIVKGSGTDLRTIRLGGFTHLYSERLARLQTKTAVEDGEMMELMQAAMLFPSRDPVPSVETPLHSLLPYRFIAHTHDVATLSLSDTPHAEENVRRVYGDDVAFLPYARPGFPLAKLVAERYAEQPPDGAIALVLEKHGLVVWGEVAKECYERLVSVISKAEAYVAERAEGRSVFGALAIPAWERPERKAQAAALLPVMRGALAADGWRPVLHWDPSDEALDAIGREAFTDVARRGVMTPEHILRAGAGPLVLDVGAGDVADGRKERIRDAFREFRDAYVERRRGLGQPEPISDFLKTVLVPGLGPVYAGKDRRSALTAAECYRATVRAMAGAEAVEAFEFLSDADACEMEYWPLERRKVEEAAAARRELEGKIALVVGAASGIGRAAAERFVEEGAHVIVADISAAGADSLARELNDATPERALALEVDVSDPESVRAMVTDAVLHFGGLDVLFYSPGVGPAYSLVAEMSDDEIEEKLRVHFQGAVAATREVAQVMIDQGIGGRLIYNASKAAFAPGEGLAAYGASKAALGHYVRNAANELG
ncbi:MAG: SDR family NAD(P)-dependent oxidoreductase, partial [Chloroflexi bacterium]|nr:SDR family NAD(P)-dependent oxidoreductase [Chloroflexota bacterium]